MTSVKLNKILVSEVVKSNYRFIFMVYFTMMPAAHVIRASNDRMTAEWRIEEGLQGTGCGVMQVGLLSWYSVERPIRKYYFFRALQPPLGVVFYSPLAGFSLLAYEVS